jgi:SAM-dependent methyltransferase
MARRIRRSPIHQEPEVLLELATSETLDVQGYLWANPDVQAAADSSADPDFPIHHLEQHGIREGRHQLRTRALPTIASMRETKLQRFLERSPGSSSMLENIRYSISDSSLQALRDTRSDGLPVAFDRMSFNYYDPEISNWIDENPDLLLLDAGAGLRTEYRQNVVNAEIAALPSTDILCFGDNLPVDDNTFDGVLCMAVLEHVPDPFAMARELMRVTQPGGKVIAAWPFLAPLHGYPHHYFNATPEGARLAFEQIEATETVETSIPSNFHPVFALRWIVDEWQAGLPPGLREEFLEMPVGDILQAFSNDALCNPWSAHGLRQPWVTGLAKEAEVPISAGTRLVVTKKR